MSTGKFTELGTNIIYVLNEILDSENLIKLIKHDVYDPLSQPIEATPASLIFNRIYPIPKIPDAQEQKKTILTATFSNAILSNNIKIKDYKLIFCIISHIDLWRVKDNLRPYLIAQEIDQIFNEKRGTQLSLGKVMFDSFIYRQWNEIFCGYHLSYDISSLN